MKAMNLIGDKYGRWNVISLAPKKGKATCYYCKCDCGTVMAVAHGSLRNGSSVSCGCFKDEVQSKRLTTHGDAKSKSRKRLYRIWAAMKSRCSNPKTEFYHLYGGKGISVCNTWLEYKPFKQWAESSGYTEDLTIDRKNSEKDYTPDNCRWLSIFGQAQNKPKYSNNTSGFTGINYHKTTGKWRASITLNSKRISLGLYYTKEEAKKCRDTFILKHPNSFHRVEK